jgi:hypothetical protein
MQKRRWIAAVLAAAMLVGSVQTSDAAYVKRFVPGGGGMSGAVGVWIIMGCAGGIILAALAANYRDGRELTAPEAWSCGLLFWASAPNGNGKKKRLRHG